MNNFRSVSPMVKKLMDEKERDLQAEAEKELRELQNKAELLDLLSQCAIINTPDFCCTGPELITRLRRIAFRRGIRINETQPKEGDK